jgi:ribonuclease E
MLIDATHPEETRVVVLNGTKLEEFDFESSTKKQIKGNIYLAKVTRVEPSLQAAFVEYGGNRHGFLAFSEIHPDYYQIPVSDREAMLAHEARYADEEDDEPEAPASRAIVDARDAADADGGDADGGNADGGNAEGTSDESYAVEPVAESFQASDEGLVPQSAYDSAETADTAEAYPEPTRAEGGHGGENNDAEDGGFIERGEAGSTVETIGGDEMEEVSTRRQRTPYRHYKIQEVIKRRQILLIQVTKEERGNKGAALTTYLSLAGRYCVLMPNAGRGGGVSRKITSAADRRRLKDLMEDLDVPEGMGVIVRTAGSERSKAEIHRDYEYLLRLWDDIRELTLRSSAPALIYEEGNLIKRAIRDLYSRDIEEVLVEGEPGYRGAKDFMRMLMPSHAARVKSYRDPVIPLFHRFQIDQQIDQIHNPTVQLRSGGYIVINPTEALVAIDVNSGRSTRERNIEETATKTNLEAADEVARQLRLRDLAGLIVIDFIDMEEGRNRNAVERRLKEAMKNDRARIQLGRVSPFGLLELSRQRLRPSLIEASTQICPHCTGTGTIRSTESTALVALRALEEEGIRRRTAEITLWVPTHVALYILNQKREGLRQIEQRYSFTVIIQQDDELIPPAYRLDRVRAFTPAELAALPVPSAAPVAVEEEPEDLEGLEEETSEEVHTESSDGAGAATPDAANSAGRRRRRRRRGRGQGGRENVASTDTASSVDGAASSLDAGDEGDEVASSEESDGPAGVEFGAAGEEGRPATPAGEGKGETRRRRRGRRSGRRHNREETAPGDAPETEGFSGFGPVEDFARDGLPYLENDVPAEQAAPIEPLNQEVAPAGVDELAPEDAVPAKRRPSRRRKTAGDSAGEAPGEAAADAPAADAPAAKPPRGRRKPAAVEATHETATFEVVTAETVTAETVAETVAPVIEIVAEPVPEIAADPQPPAEPVPVEPEPTPEAVPGAEVIIVGESNGGEPARRGWWRRLI